MIQGTTWLTPPPAWLLGWEMLPILIPVPPHPNYFLRFADAETGPGWGLGALGLQGGAGVLVRGWR